MLASEALQALGRVEQQAVRPVLEEHARRGAVHAGAEHQRSGLRHAGRRACLAKTCSGGGNQRTSSRQQLIEFDRLIRPGVHVQKPRRRNISGVPHPPPPSGPPACKAGHRNEMEPCVKTTRWFVPWVRPV
eukprot:scaffold118079_cov50-Phaeocystis_antarctica.AAC.2